MIKTADQFEAQVRMLESYAARHPARYRLKVALLAMAGYAYLFLILVVLLMLVGVLALGIRVAGYVAIQIGIAALALIAAILRALWVRIPRPKGRVLTSKQVPKLLNMVEEIRRTLHAPKIHTVVLSGDFNAGVAYHPRLGVLGWPRRYLILGLPLMSALTPEQFRAVLAHEFGHVSANHGRFSSWIYRVRMTWFQLLTRLEQEKRSGSAMIRRFGQWYAPLFSAYSFVLARAHEYEADHCAAEVAGAGTAAEALLAIAARNRFLDGEFWPGVSREIPDAAEPPAGVFTRLSQSLRAPAEGPDFTRWLEGALREPTGYADPHPSLADRLAALGALAGPSESRGNLQVFKLTPLEQSAAEFFLGEEIGPLTHWLSEEWREKIRPRWREDHNYLQTARRDLQALEAKAEAGPVNVEEAWLRAGRTAELYGPLRAEPLLREVLRLNPHHASAHFLLGKLLLERKDEAGVAHLEKVMAGDPNGVIPACQLLYAYFQEQGRDTEARACETRAREHQGLLARAQQERQGITLKDRFLPHGLPGAQVGGLVRQLARYANVERAIFVRKEVKLLPENPFFVLGVFRRGKWVEFSTQRQDNMLARQLAQEVAYPGETLVIILNRSNWRVRRALRQVSGAVIFDRKQRAPAPQSA